ARPSQPTRKTRFRHLPGPPSGRLVAFGAHQVKRGARNPHLPRCYEVASVAVHRISARPAVGPPIDGSDLATTARGASWPTGQRHTCRLVRYAELLSRYGSDAPRPAAPAVGHAADSHSPSGAPMLRPCPPRIPPKS